MTATPNAPRRAGAWVLIVLGAFGLLLVLAAIIAIWAVNAPLTDIGTSTLDTIAAPLARAESGLQEVNDRLDSAQASIDELQSTLATVGENLKADSLVLRALGSLVSEDLKTSVDKAAAALADVQSAAATVENVLNGLDQLPGVTLPSWVEDVSAAIEGVAEAGQKVQETVGALNALRTGAIETAVASVTEKTDQLEAGLSKVQERTQTAQTSVANLRATLEAWRTGLAGLIDTASVVLTMLLALMGLGQWALLSLGWSRVKTGQWIPFYPLRKGEPAAVTA